MQNRSITSFGKATAPDLSFHGKSSASLESPIRISDPNSLAYPFSLSTMSSVETLRLLQTESFLLWESSLLLDYPLLSSNAGCSCACLPFHALSITQEKMSNWYVLPRGLLECCGYQGIVLSLVGGQTGLWV